MTVDILEFIPYYMYKEALPLETVASVISYSNQQPYLWRGGCFFDACVFTLCQIAKCLPPARLFSSESPPEEASNYSAKGVVTALLFFLMTVPYFMVSHFHITDNKAFMKKSR